MTADPALDPRRVEAADVYKGEVCAGLLERVEGSVRFSYRADYLAGAEPAIATRLPRTATPEGNPGRGAAPVLRRPAARGHAADRADPAGQDLGRRHAQPAARGRLRLCRGRPRRPGRG